MMEELSVHKEKRIESFDILKCICAFLIICIHKPFPGYIGEYFTALTRIAVPLFFMITGYFLKQTLLGGSFKKQLCGVFKLLIGANVLYTLFDILLALYRGNLFVWIENCIGLKAIIKFILFNVSPFSDHLWYLSALLYVLLIIGAVNRIRGGYQGLYLLIPILLAGDLVFGKYSIAIFGRELPYIIVRNFLFVGLPYFLLGDLIRQKQPRLRESLVVYGAFIFSITTILERYFLVLTGMNATRDHYISTTFLACCIFLLCICLQEKDDMKNEMKNRSLLATIGKKYSAIIYIIHPVIITVFGFVMNRLTLEDSAITDIYDLFGSVFVFFVALLLSLFLIHMRKFRFRKEN